MRLVAFWTFLVFLVFFTACGPSNLELWQRESAQAREQCAQVRGSRVERMRACKQRRHEVDRKYGQPQDVFFEATIAYWIAVAERVDRGELTEAQGESLASQFRAYMEGQRQQAELLKSSQRALDAAAYQAFWSNFWQSWNVRPGEQPRTPIRCHTYAIGTSIYTDCK